MEISALSADLEAALLRTLSSVWHDVNATYFRRAMRPPTFRLVDAEATLGRFLPDERAIEMSRRLVVERPWGAVVEVLKHEMAHQFVHEVMGLADAPAHGPAFSEVCARFGIDARAVGLPDGAAGEGSRILQRIAKLLALSGSPNRNEAEIAMAEAQRLMLKHNIDNLGAPRADGYCFRHLGEPTGRVGEAARILANLLEEHFFVECIWIPVWRPREGKRGSVLEICGTPENLEIASWVHGFLERTAGRLWTEYKSQAGLRGDRDRRTFLAGVMIGFREKLSAGRSAARREGLVWVKDRDLEGYFRRRHPSIRWTRHAGSAESAAHRDGKDAGRQIVMHRPVTAPKTSGPRLLPGR